MAESIDIRELNERIERQSAFVTNLTTGMDQIIVVRNIWLNHCLSDYSPMVMSFWKVCLVWQKLWLLKLLLL